MRHIPLAVLSFIAALFSEAFAQQQRSDTGAIEPAWVKYSISSHALITPDGKSIIARLMFGKGVGCWDATSGDLLWLKEFEPPCQIAISPDGRYLAVAGEGVTILERSAMGYNVVRELVYPIQAGKRFPLYSHAKRIAFSPDGRYLVEQHNHGMVLWNLLTYSHVPLPAHIPISSRAPFFSGDGRHLLMARRGSDSIEVRVLPELKLERTLVLRTIPDSSSFPAILPARDGGILIGTSGKGVLVAADLATGAVRWRAAIDSINDYDPEAPRFMAFSPDMKELAIAKDDGLIEFRDASTGALSRSIRHLPLPRTIDWFPDGHRILIGGGRRTPAVVDAMSGEERFEIGSGYSGNGHLVHIDGGRILVSGESSGYLKLLEAGSGEKVGEMFFPGIIQGVAATGDSILAIVNEGVLRKGIRTNHGTKLYTIAPHERKILSVRPITPRYCGHGSFSPQADRALLIPDDSTFIIVMIPEGSSRTFSINKARLFHMPFSPDGQRFAIHLYSGPIEIRSAEDGSILSTIPAGERERRATFAPDGRIILWEVDSAYVQTNEKEMMFGPPVYTGSHQYSRFSPSGRLVALGDDRGVTLRSYPDFRLLGRYSRKKEIIGEEDQELLIDKDDRTITFIGMPGHMMLWHILR